MSGPEPPNLIIEDREGYLFVEYSGNPLLLDAMLTTVNTAAARIRELGYKNVLIIRNAPLLESDASRALIASMVRRLAPEDVRYAIVDRYGNDPAAARAAAHASRRAGWNLHPFDTEEEALEWLRTA